MHIAQTRTDETIDRHGTTIEPCVHIAKYVKLLKQEIELYTGTQT